VVDADGHFGLQVGEIIFGAELFDLRGFVWGLGGRCESCAGRGRIGNVDPDKVVLLFAVVASGVDAIDFQILIGGERGDELALAVVHVELPSVISALEIFAVEAAAVEGHTAMRAGVAQGEGLAEAVAADDEGDLEQRRFVELVAMNAVGGESAIPEAGEHERVGGLALRVEIGHENF